MEKGFQFLEDQGYKYFCVWFQEDKVAQYNLL